MPLEIVNQEQEVKESGMKTFLLEGSNLHASQYAKKFYSSKVSSVFLLKLARFIIPLLFLVFWMTELKAEPGKGFGLALEGGSFKPIDPDTGKDFQSSDSYGAAFDYQWPLGKSVSFSIFGFEHGGMAKLPPKSDYEYYKTGVVGAELKAWIDSFFIGIHGGQYYLTWIESLSSYSGIAQTGGSGYGLGFETESGWMFAAYSEKSGTFEHEEMADQKVEGNRILLGYRWR